MPHKNWREIAKAIQTESDSDKLSKLVAKLCQALEDQHQKLDADEEVSTTINEPGRNEKQCETEEFKEVAQKESLEKRRQRHPGERLQR